MAGVGDAQIQPQCGSEKGVLEIAGVESEPCLDQTTARQNARQLRASWGRSPTCPVVAVCALTLLNYFQFPGHTYLQADTQIYVPILEHIWDPSALPADPIVLRPHVSFTIYDEVAEALRKLTGRGFRDVLAGQQIFFRALGIWGLYLIASSAGLSTPVSLLVA